MKKNLSEKEVPSLAVESGAATNFERMLHTILPKPCCDRPFVCRGNPSDCTAIVIGENPASSTSEDWWDYWDDTSGYDFALWQKHYHAARISRGKSATSPTRWRLDRLFANGVNCLESNVHKNEKQNGCGKGSPNSAVLQAAIDGLPNLVAIVAHGKVAERFAAAIDIPPYIDLIVTKHFRLMSYAAVDEVSNRICIAETRRAEWLEEAAPEQRLPGKKAPRVVLHIPHSSTLIPDDVRGQFSISNAELEREILQMTDHYTDEIFASLDADATEVVFPVSRLVVDPERFVEDENEPMSEVGMGVIYTRKADGERLRNYSPEDQRVALIDEYYWPHHERLTTAVNSALADRGNCLVLDCHSFPSVALPYEKDKNQRRPDICIGTDPYHTPNHLEVTAVRVFKEAGFDVSTNRPFAGALVPLEHFAKDSRVHALMIEVNRSLYIDESTGAKLDYFDDIRQRLRECLRYIFVSSHAARPKSSKTLDYLR